MRILFTFVGGIGHFLPLVRIARAAETRGHRVAFGGQSALLPTVERAGFQAIDTGGATFRDDSERLPLLNLDMDREYRAVRDRYAGSLARARAAAIIERSTEWKPDLVVCDEMDFGCVVAAERLSIPHATMLVIAAGSLARRELIAEPLNALRADHGLPPDPDLAMLSRYLVLSPFPPSFRDPAFPLPDTAHSFRPVAPDGPDSTRPPEWLASLPRRPTVYLTLGTVFNVESGDLFRRVLEGIRTLPVNVLVTVGPQIDPQELGAQPGNVHIEKYVDQWSLLPGCDLVVSHAGSGTVMGALAHGLPMILLPMGADQPLNAGRCKELGIARVLDPTQITPELAREAGAEALVDPSYRRAAERMRDEIANLPHPTQAVILLERLAAEDLRNSQFGKNAAEAVCTGNVRLRGVWPPPE
jgi:MGT family glycosyltransferase